MTKNNYSQLKLQLDQLISQMEDESLDIDEALKLYQKCQSLIAEMDKYLKTAEVQIKKISQDR